jgi:hypothetical protein
MALKMDFSREIYALLKKGINYNQRAMWKVEVAPRADALPSLTFLLLKFVDQTCISASVSSCGNHH